MGPRSSQVSGNGIGFRGGIHGRKLIEDGYQGTQ